MTQIVLRIVVVIGRSSVKTIHDWRDDADAHAKANTESKETEAKGARGEEEVKEKGEEEKGTGSKDAYDEDLVD